MAAATIRHAPAQVAPGIGKVVVIHLKEEQSSLQPCKESGARRNLAGPSP